MGLRASLLFGLSRRRLPPPAKRTVDYSTYQRWRHESLTTSWSVFSDDDVRGKDVLDFGCGDGALGLFFAANKAPRSVTGVDLRDDAIKRACAALADASVPAGVQVTYHVGSEEGLPISGESIDTIVAFDCLEHVMSPLPIFQEWHRVLRPGGKCLLEWFPFKGPWGPHMEALIPVPWAHVLFGEAAMFRAAERIYDLPEFVPRHWDLDENSVKKPNKWRQWSTFRQQGYVNELDVRTFEALATRCGLQIARLERHSFSGAAWRKSVGRLLMSVPLIGAYFESFVVIELVKPRATIGRVG